MHLDEALEVLRWMKLRWQQTAIDQEAQDAFFEDVGELPFDEVMAAVKAYHHEDHDWPPKTSRIRVMVEEAAIDPATFRPRHGVAENAWAAARARLEGALPASTFRIWIAPLVAIGADGNTILLAAPDRHAAWVERRYLPLLREAITDFSHIAVTSYEKAAVDSVGQAPASSRGVATSPEIRFAEAIAA